MQKFSKSSPQRVRMNACPGTCARPVRRPSNVPLLPPGLLRVARFAQLNIWNIAGGAAPVRATGGEVRTRSGQGWSRSSASRQRTQDPAEAIFARGVSQSSSASQERWRCSAAGIARSRPRARTVRTSRQAGTVPPDRCFRCGSTGPSVLSHEPRMLEAGRVDFRRKGSSSTSG